MRIGFEPTRAEHIGLAVQRLNHSATSSGVHLRNILLSRQTIVYGWSCIMKSFYDFSALYGQGAQKLLVAENCTILFLSEYHKQTKIAKIYEKPFVQAAAE